MLYRTRIVLESCSYRNCNRPIRSNISWAPRREHGVPTHARPYCGTVSVMPQTQRRIVVLFSTRAQTAWRRMRVFIARIWRRRWITWIRRRPLGLYRPGFVLTSSAPLRHHYHYHHRFISDYTQSFECTRARWGAVCRPPPAYTGRAGLRGGGKLGSCPGASTTKGPPQKTVRKIIT